MIKDGCKYHPDCFTCSYPDCIIGNHTVKLRLKAQELKAQGINKREIAERLGKSERTIERYLKRTDLGLPKDTGENGLED